MWRKRDKGEGISTRNLNSKSLWSELSPPPYHQQKTGLFRNTMIAPATHQLATGTDPYRSGLLLGPPQGRALRLPFGSASLRTNGPSPRLLFPRPPRVDRGADPYIARQRGLRLTPHPSRLTFFNFPLSTFCFSITAGADLCVEEKR